MAQKAAKEATAATTAPSAPKATTEERPNLPCALEDYFQLVVKMWENCLARLAEFQKRSDRYTEEFVNEQIAFVETVKAMPNEATRTAAFTAVKVQLLADYQALNSMYKRLSKAISYAYKEEALILPEWKSAGVTAYGEAQSRDWSAAATFITAANNYLATKGKFLVEQKAVKSTFEDEFKAVGAAFTAKRKEYIQKETDARDGTSQQHKAIKLIQNEYIPMMDDGKSIYEFNEEERRHFTETYLLDFIRGNHPSGLKGYLRNIKGNKKTGIKGVKVYTEDAPQDFATSDEMGLYELRKASGTYNFVFQWPEGLPYVLKDRQIKVGVMSRFNLEPSPTPVEPETSAAEPLVDDTPPVND